MVLNYFHHNQIILFSTFFNGRPLKKGFVNKSHQFASNLCRGVPHRACSTSHAPHVHRGCAGGVQQVHRGHAAVFTGHIMWCMQVGMQGVQPALCPFLGPRATHLSCCCTHGNKCCKHRCYLFQKQQRMRTGLLC